jgi:prevent-host-death family protein
MLIEISAEELAAQFFEYLERVQLGETLVITADGRAVAQLMPTAEKRSAEEVAAVIEDLRSMRCIEGVSGETVIE